MTSTVISTTTRALAPRPRSRALLDAALRLDAAASAAIGAGLALAAGPLASWFGLPAGLLREAGLTLLPFAAFVAYVAGRVAGGSPVWRAGVAAVVAANAAWALASPLALVGRPATALGAAFVLGQGLVVLAFAAAEWAGLRRATAPGAA